ncbi:MAG: hypothetical protein ACKPKO_41165, partial [Candidatus Fonsibacter sp.]
FNIIIRCYYTQSTINVVGNIATYVNISSVGSISAGTTLSAGGTISTVGNITASAGTITGKNGSFQNLVVTGGTVKPSVPTFAGVYIGLDSGSTNGGIEICSSSLQYNDFSTPRVDFKGRIIYGYGFDDFQFWSNSTSSANMTLNSTGLNVVRTVSTTSDKRFKFNENQ